MIELKPFETRARRVVHVDQPYAIQAVQKLRLTHVERESRYLVEGQAAVNLLAEYGVILHEHIVPPTPGGSIAIVLCPPAIWFCPSSAGLDGVFIEEYDPMRHGKGFKVNKRPDLLGYTNIDAKLDAQHFYALMGSS